MTSIDRALLREADRNILVSSTATDAFDQTVRIGRLRKLEKLGLAAPQGATHWRLVPNLADTLRRMGERDDIIRTMQRAFTARGAAPALADQLIYDPAAPSASPMIGRVIERGLADEMNDSHYVLVDATDGRTYYVGIGKGENFEALPLRPSFGSAPRRPLSAMRIELSQRSPLPTPANMILTRIFGTIRMPVRRSHKAMCAVSKRCAA